MNIVVHVSFQIIVLYGYMPRSGMAGSYGNSIFILFIFLYIYLFYYLFLFLAVLGLRCCARAFSGYGEWGLLFVAVRGLLIAVASLVGCTGSGHVGFSSCDMWAQ